MKVINFFSIDFIGRDLESGIVAHQIQIPAYYWSILLYQEFENFKINCGGRRCQHPSGWLSGYYRPEKEGNN